MAGIRDLLVGRLGLPTIFDDVSEQAGGVIETVADAVFAAGRKPRAVTLSLPVHGTSGDLDPYAVGMRMRRQTRALVANHVLRPQGHYLRFGPDSALNGFYMIGTGDVAYVNGGPTTAEFKVALSDVFLVARVLTHRRGLRFDVYDRRVATTARDVLRSVYSTAFSAYANAVGLVGLIPVGAYGIQNVATGVGYRSTPLRPGADGGVPIVPTTLLSSGVPSVWSYEVADVDYGKGDVVLLDRRGLQDMVPTGGANLIPNPFFEVDTDGWVSSGASNTLASGATLTRTTTAGQFDSGIAGMSVVTTNASASEGAASVTPGFTYKAGVTYTFRVRLKGNAGSEALQLMFGATTVTGSDFAFANITLTSSFATYSVSWTPTADRSGTSYGVTVRTQTAAAVTFFVDNAVVPWDDPYSNLATTPSFNVTQGAWVGTAQGPIGAVSTLSLSSARVFTGTQSLAVAVPATASAKGASTRLAGTFGVGRSYSASVWVWVGTTQNVSVAIQDNQLGLGGNTTTVSVPANTWTPIGVSWVPTADAAFPWVYAFLASGAAAQTFYVGAAVVVASPTVPTTYFDGDSAGWGWLGGSGGAGNAISSLTPAGWQDVVGYEEVYGPDQDLTALDVPVMTNGQCRVRYLRANTANVALAVDDYVPGTGYVEHGRIFFQRRETYPAGASIYPDVLRAAYVAEWTPDRAVVALDLTTSAGGGGQALDRVFVTLQRGWTGPRVEVYPGAQANGTAGGAAIFYEFAEQGSHSVYKTNGSAGVPTANGLLLSDVPLAGTGNLGDLGTVGGGSSLGEPFVSVVAGAAFSNLALAVEVVTQGFSGQVQRASSPAAAYGATRTYVQLYVNAAGVGYVDGLFGNHQRQADQTLEAEAIRVASGTTSQVADALASGGQLVRDTQTAESTNTLQRVTGLRAGAYRVWARVRTNGGTGVFHAVVPGAGAAAATGAVTVAALGWVDLGEFSPTSANWTLQVNAWRGTASSVDVDRVEVHKLQDNDAASGTWDGARDVAQGYLYSAVSSPVLVARAGLR